MPKTNYSLTIGWLYPDLMSTYGDRGNITVLQKRCLWRGIGVEIVSINEKTTKEELEKIDLLFGGGAQDTEQSIVMKDLKGEKGDVIKTLIEHDIPALFVCGSPQLMGISYEPSVGEKIEGLGIFDMVSKHPGLKAKRLIGNTVGKIYWDHIDTEKHTRHESYIVGFENHGGRSYLGSKAKPLAQVIKGHGNNDSDGEEGVVYKNAIGCYYHGPLLPKNPHFADFLIKKALEVKYKEVVVLPELDDTMEYEAQRAIAKKLGVRL